MTNAVRQRRSGEVRRRRMSDMAKREAASGYLFILPNFLGFLVFTAIPIVAGLVISFTDYTGFAGAQFKGIANYAQLLKDFQFKAAFWNNLYYSFTSVPLTILMALGLSLLLNKKRPLGGLFKTVYFFPNLTSMVAIACVAMMLFDPSQGPINMLLKFFGMPLDDLPQWFFSSKLAMITVVICVVWKQAGFYMVMFLGGLKNIPGHLYEAARMDGANAWQCFRHVTLPMLSPTTFMATILCFIGSFQVFDIINMTTQGGPGRATTVIVYRIYLESFRNFKMGYASSMAYVLFLLVFIITLIQWQGQRKWVNVD